MSNLTPYEQWDIEDYARFIAPEVENGSIKNFDGKLVMYFGHSFDSPWLHVKQAEEEKLCSLYRRVFFAQMGIIHTRCQECWKIVVAPRTLKELFQLHKLQKKLDLPSKCGLELRDYIPRLYGGYFYASSLDEGRLRYDLVRNRVSERISPSIEVVLKRACTEYEQKFGPSDRWGIFPRQKQIEKDIGELVECKYLSKSAPSFIEANIKKAWVQYACSHGDETYKEFTGGQSLAPSIVTYHDNLEVK
jgi:hypothetical protein